MAGIHNCFVQKILIWLLVFSFPFTVHSATKQEKLTGIYFPSGCLYGRSFQGIVHYMKSAGLNLAVLHAKDPLGQLFWKSENNIAQNMQASAPNSSLETAISALKQMGIWTAAKLDVFQDSLLVTNNPEMGVRDSGTGQLWADHKGLLWANPYDIRVWDYTIALCLELAEIGIDEIQFDYIRFPSDGDMSVIEYPIVIEGISKEECIIDHILTCRKIDFNLWTSRRTKIMHMANLIIQDLDIDPQRMHPSPIYIDWDGDCVFTKSIPQERLELYLSHNEGFQLSIFIQ